MDYVTSVMKNVLVTKRSSKC